MTMLTRAIHILAQIRTQDRTVQVYCQYIAEFTEVETHLSIKLSKKNFGGTLRPKSVMRTLVIGLIYGPRANEQFDIAF